MTATLLRQAVKARMGDKSAVIVIGASAGGVEALRILTESLPADLACSLLIVLHIGAHRSELPILLNQWGKLPACHPADGTPLRQGHIYVAPPDYHMVLEDGAIRLTRGPRENWARPAIDPLFRSAARAYGAGVAGVILTGGLNDGTAGLFEIKARGGTTIVQRPDDATEPSMPRSALRHVVVDHCLPVAEMPALLERLVAGPHRVGEAAQASMSARMGSEEMAADYTLEDPVAVTCPDCGGALRRTELGTLVQYTCHIGHVYTADIMVAAQFAAMEWSLAAAMRALSERGELCRQMADRCRQAHDSDTAARWDGAMRQAMDRTGVLRELLEREWTHPGESGSLTPQGR